MEYKMKGHTVKIILLSKWELETIIKLNYLHKGSECNTNLVKFSIKHIGANSLDRQI